MSAPKWNEIVTAKEENRHELKLSGPSISDRISKNGLDSSLFDLTHLNFLSISDTCLDNIPDSICSLINLSSLVLHSNKIKTITSSVCKLSKLKNLDMSRNLLEDFPTEVGDLSALYSLNLSFNNISSFPSLLKNSWLTILDLSNNSLEDFPDVCTDKLNHLSEVRLSSNKIKEIPHNIKLLPSLKMLDVSENKIKDVPGELSDISKLKELKLNGNPLSDKRLGKMVIQCHSKQVLDYIRQNGKRNSDTGKTASSKGKKGQRATSVSESGSTGDPGQDSNDVNQLCNRIEVLHVSETTPVVIIDKEVKSVRPHIVCCIVKDLSFTSDIFKKFIKVQTHLHDTICNKRQAATLATHDLSSIASGALKYVARAPDQVKLQPLGSTKETLASVVFSRLRSHAHSVMMDRKRNKYSGIHKFLYLLEGKPLYPFLLDASDKVISFPPLTNSESSKMSVNSKEMLIEVTSSTSQAVCRKVLDTFLLECLRLGISAAKVANETETTSQSSNVLTVEQVKVVDSAGLLQVVYPSRGDLVFEEADAIRVIRNYE